MKNLKTLTFFTFLLLINLIPISCSSSKNTNEADYSDYYLNLKYESKKFNDVSLGIIMQEYGLDTLSKEELQGESAVMFDFGKTFTEYFPIGIKNFSTIKKVDWIYYNQNIFSESIIYKFNSSPGKEISISLPYSMNHFKSLTDVDFLMFIKYFTIQHTPEELSKTNSKVRKFYRRCMLEYYIWDNKNFELITIDKIEPTSEFDKLPETLPFRNIILKMAFEIFQKLPMFQE